MSTRKKIVCIAGVLAGLAAVLLVLTHTAQNGVETVQLLPQINSEPVYVKCVEGEELQVSLLPKEDFNSSGFMFLLVNISEESRGTVRIALTDSASNLLVNEVVPVETITPGKWVAVQGNISFTAGEEYGLSILADGSEPYFMQVPEEALSELPFEEKVWQEDTVLPYGISLGVNKTVPTKVTYGDIFYYSIPASILLSVFLILWILLGREKMSRLAAQIPVKPFIKRYGNEAFLLLLLGAVCISIYARAYLKGVYISSDSAGYMREAVNLANGNGFCYDGLAGYQSWFAKWPILYPALIALVMLLTKANVYLASKLVAMLMVAGLFLVLRLSYKKDAWVYALCLTNIGFLNLCYYTWSEVPFMLFLVCFSLALAGIVSGEAAKPGHYVFLGSMGLCCFLTRYYGIFVWIVTGGYILLFLLRFWKQKEKAFLQRAVKLSVTAVVSGCLSLLYLLMNKRMNGMASGVSRSMWWDDYRTLTDDLIESLLTEFFNIFSMQIPELIENLPYRLKVFVVVLILAGICWFVKSSCRHFTRESVLITMSVMYSVIFIGIRYVSSMDSFYFRFFEPATFLLCLGLIGLLLPQLKGKKAFSFFAGAVSVLIVIAATALFENGSLTQEEAYYDTLTGQWEEAYAEIPEKSVIIFNDIDFRASWYRPDVVDGTITPLDTLEELKAVYYGSEYLCIKEEFATVMLESGEYDRTVQEWLKQGVDHVESGQKYVVLPLR